MRIVLKPGGYALLLVCLSVLTIMVFRPRVSPGQEAAFWRVDPEGRYVVVSASDYARGELRQDGTAFRGQYMHVTGAYEPMLIAPIPDAAAAEFTVWADLRATDAQLKGQVKGTQREYEWAMERWNLPQRFHWVRMGRHTRAEMGDSLIVIRGGDKSTSKDEGLSAVLLARDDDFNPNAVRI